jgi:hypothetical protein
MSNLNRVVAQLQSERNHIEQKLQRLTEAIHVIQGIKGRGRGSARRVGTKPSRRITAAARARMAAAQRARRANEKGVTGSKPRHMSAAARRRIAAAQKARWMKLKGQQVKEKKVA